MKIIKYIKNIKLKFMIWMLFSNLVISNDFINENKLDKISRIIYEPTIINNYIKYPDLAKNFSISGTSTALFIVNKEGKIENIKIERSLGIAFDRQILDGLNKISREILQEKKYKTNNTYRLSVYFKN